MSQLRECFRPDGSCTSIAMSCAYICGLISRRRLYGMSHAYLAARPGTRGRDAHGCHVRLGPLRMHVPQCWSPAADVGDCHSVLLTVGENFRHQSRLISHDIIRRGGAYYEQGIWSCSCFGLERVSTAVATEDGVASSATKDFREDVSDTDPQQVSNIAVERHDSAHLRSQIGMPPSTKPLEKGT